MRSLIRRLRTDANKDNAADRLVFGVLAAFLEDAVARLHTAITMRHEVEAMAEINAVLARVSKEYARVNEPLPWV